MTGSSVVKDGANLIHEWGLNGAVAGGGGRRLFPPTFCSSLVSELKV